MIFMKFVEEFFAVLPPENSGPCFARRIVGFDVSVKKAVINVEPDSLAFRVFNVFHASKPPRVNGNA